jgi:hypothetical protein
MISLPDDVVEFVQRGISVLVGSRDARLMPECIRAVGVRVERGAQELTIFLPTATSARVLANLRENGRIAITVAHTDHHSIQIKGKVLRVASARPADRELVERYRCDLAQNWGYIGVPPRFTLRLAHWPCHAVRFRVETAFDQTPGPRAGDVLAEAVS